MSPKITLYVRDESVWDRAKAAAAGESLSELVTKALRAYLDKQGAPDVELSVEDRARRARAELDALIKVARRELKRGERDSEEAERLLAAVDRELAGTGERKGITGRPQRRKPRRKSA